jgi:3-hydroxybutyryl-CoA dehydratase
MSAAAATPDRTYFEDVVVDTRHETPGMTVTEAHVALYAGLTGDETPGAGLAPELLALCLSTGLGWRIDRPPLVVLAFMGIEWKVLRPLRIGDTIRSISRTAVKRGMREGGVVIEEHAVVDQRGEILQQGRFTFLVARRPA